MLPDVTVTIQDGTQGLISGSSEQLHAIVGTCSKGTVNTLYAFGDLATLVSTLGQGPAVEAAAYSLAVHGGIVYVIKIAESAPGAPGAVTQTGQGPTLTVPTLTPVTSTGTAPPVVTLSGTPTIFANIKVVIVLGGPRGTATFKVSTDGGTTYGTTTVTAATYLIPGTGLTLNFPTGADYSDTNVYTASSCVPNDSHEFRIEILTGGALGTSTYRYSLDAINPRGATWSQTLTTPTTGLYIIPGSGLTITWAAGTYVVGTTYDLLALTAPAYTTTEITAALTALLADPREWGAVHLVGQASSVSGSVTIASALDTQMATAASNFRFAFAMLELPDDESASNANIISGTASFASTRVSPWGGFCRITSVLTGRSYKRSSAWVGAARMSKVGIGVDLGRVSDGPVPGVSYLHHDEQSSPTLDAARVSSLRSIIGKQGVYITNGRLFAPAGSDFVFIQYRRVMDVACRTARNALLEFLNAGVRVNTDGTIYELDARGIEAAVDSALNAALTQPGHASSASLAVIRTNNIQSTQQLQTQCRARPLGYAKNITLDIGFTSPALVLN